MATTTAPLSASAIYRGQNGNTHAAIVVRTYSDGSADLYVIRQSADGAEYKARVPRGDPANPALGTFSLAGGSAGATGSETLGPLALQTTNWSKALSKIESGVAGSRANIVCIGDSWTSNDLIYAPVRKYLRGMYGDAGAGYVSLTSRVGIPESTVTVTTTGTWTETDGLSTSAGVDVSDTTSTDAATPAKKTITVTSASSFVVHYQKKPNGGDFSWALDGGAETVITTAAATKTYSTLTIPTGGTSGSHALALKIQNAGTAGVTLMGVEVNKDDVSGVRMHRVGNGGKRAIYWSQTCTLWQSGYPLLAPDLTFILFGVNEKAQNVSLDTYQQSLIDLANICKSLAPNTDLIIIGPADTGTPNTNYVMQKYVDRAQAAASSVGAGFITAIQVLGPYSASSPFWQNDSHLSASGGQVFANLINPALTSGPQQGSAGTTASLAFQKFTATGSTTIASGANWIDIVCVGAGGGGGAPDRVRQASPTQSAVVVVQRVALRITVLL
jgi:lysophospholipase L1-like esterase